MSGSAGLRRVVRFNWPWYAAALAGLAVGAALLRLAPPAAPWSALLVAALLVAGFWLVASLSVSHLVYDRSGLAAGAWLDGIDPASVRRAAVFHAGQDEASETASRRLPQARLRAFDVQPAAGRTTPSLRRARALAGPRGERVAPGSLPLEDRSLDLGLLVFAAHELRLDEQRALLFRELERALAPAGRLLVVEHLRDGWNLLAYGPGALHFLPRATWLATFGEARLRLVSESRCTPFVRRFELASAR